MMQQPLRVLVVDDDVDNALSLGELLTLEGHSVRVVHTGEDAVSAYVHEDFNVAFMDVMLPGKNGVESFIQIRRFRPEAKVYMMTGYSVEQLLTQALEGGALGVLDKPFDPDDIMRMTTSIGPNGLLLAPPQQSNSTKDLGAFIHQTLNANGLRCRHLRDERSVPEGLSNDEILVLDFDAPLIRGVEKLKSVQSLGHCAPTVIVPHAYAGAAADQVTLADISVTGILNKPFDPLDLINRLPRLAA
jgi:two-component system, NtrC family, response regulator HydG